MTGQADFNDILRNATGLLRGMWTHRWEGLAAAWGVGLLALVALFFVPHRYEATARLYVNTDSILKPLMRDITVQPNDEQRITMLSRVVISRPNIETLVQKSGLEAQARTPGERERIVDGLMKSLEFRSAGRGNLYTLAYRDRDPKRAQEIIELLTAMFIESNKGSKASDTDAAKRFIEEQIGIYEKKLQEAEGRLKEFRLRYLGMNPGDGRDFFVRMNEASNQLNQARLELREAERARDALRQGLSTAGDPAGAAPAAAANAAAVAEIDARIESMRRNLDALLQRYTPSHPDVTGAQRVIRELEEQRHQAVLARRSGATLPAPASGTGAPRAADQLMVSLTQAEAQVASLSARVGEYAARYEKLKSSAALVPQLEAEYAQLNRDYDVNKRNYEGLVTRRESANISGEMQSVEGVADFRIVDPPRVSPRPVSPNRFLLFPVALVAALGAGVGVAWLARQVRPTFLDGRSLRETTGLPLLGVVSQRVTAVDSAKKRQSHLRFAGAIAGLVGLYATTFVVLEVLSSRMA